ncbi:MAG: hypothetical protein N3E38_01165 [Candidatus Aenigmarchaeota archaeon]|nr:hypothetical protein [Candidatus Aenigmarchaeota archaeon]MCX8179332.1 hypothetical protein [Candidatus Aenigmarchaeota archaeon]
MKRKAQSAMEYLMTYGWAILIIVVVIAALYAMGVFKTRSTVPCSPCFGYFAYVDHSTDTLVLRNGPKEVNISAGSGDQSGCTFNPTVTYSPGQEIRLTGCNIQNNERVVIAYTSTDSGLTKTDSATLRNV